MQKPDEIKSRTFKKNLGGGYNAAEIDAFIAEVAADYEKLYSDNAELLTKLELLVERVAAYKKDEKELKTAVANVRLLCDSLIDEANKKSEEIVSRAAAASSEITAMLDKTIKEKKAEINKLNDEITEYREKLLFRYRVHYDSIMKLPALVPIDEKALSEEAEKKAGGAKTGDISIPIIFSGGKAEEEESEIIAEAPYNDTPEEEAAEEAPEDMGKTILFGPDEEIEEIKNAARRIVEAQNEQAEEQLGFENRTFVFDKTKFDFEAPDEEEEPIVSKFKENIRFGEEYRETEPRRGLFGKKKKQ